MHTYSKVDMLCEAYDKTTNRLESDYRFLGFRRQRGFRDKQERVDLIPIHWNCEYA